ncbi:MAG: hypothetical protein PHI31_09860 [Desulfuromonadaceae bacterium]|nr:hypothetical protein [Desulfuromonadaceae bacterium]
MEISILKIGSLDIATNDKISVIVGFHHEIDGYGYNAEVAVWLPKEDLLLSDLKTRAIDLALGFLGFLQQAQPCRPD